MTDIKNSEFMRLLRDMKASGKSYGWIAASTGYSRSAIAGYFNRYRDDEPQPQRVCNRGKSPEAIVAQQHGQTMSGIARRKGLGDKTVRKLIRKQFLDNAND